MKDFATTCLAGVILALLLLIVPFLCIWSLNTIGEYSTGFYIEHNFWTYLSAFILCSIAHGATRK